MRGTGGNEVNDDNPGKADSGSSNGAASATGSAKNPCTLIAKSRVQAIVGEPVSTPEEAPLGPTCIYRALKSSSNITLEVESASFQRIRDQLRKVTKVTLGGHTIYCGSYGGPVTVARVDNYQLLKVSAPCTIGPTLAAQALQGLRKQ